MHPNEKQTSKRFSTHHAKAGENRSTLPHRTRNVPRVRCRIWAKPRCLWNELLVAANSDAQGKCSIGTPSSKSPEMIHVWFLDHRQGPFATQMRLSPDLLEKLAEREF